MWNFSRHIDVMCAIWDEILAQPGNTLFSTCKARSLAKRLEADEAGAQDKLASERIQEMPRTNMELALAGARRFSIAIQNETVEKAKDLAQHT
jgi:hypothetical protein